MSSTTPTYQQNIDLLTSSADKNLISKKLDLERFRIHSNNLEEAGDD